jgi:hypothetical protein
MRFFGWPFIWGPQAPSAATAGTPSVTTPVWTALGAVAQAWQADPAGLLPRFQHLYPQDSDLGWTKAESP